MQSTSHLLMIRPKHFSFNRETSSDNVFQKDNNSLSKNIQKLALAEFNQFVNLLKSNSISVLIIDDTDFPKTPDALFPNNWISFHKNGDIGIYPLMAKNRRAERRDDILEIISEKGFDIQDIMDYSRAEGENIYLEGTGSVVLDRENEIAYCALSERSNEDLFIEFCEDFEYFPCVFDTMFESKGSSNPIYHTNVLLTLTSHFALICLDVIPNKSDQKEILKHLKRTKKEIITISIEQMKTFCGNCLEVQDIFGNLKLIMSTSAYQAFNQDQKSKITLTHQIIHSPLQTIETYGGGSARCMIAEIFNPKL